MTAGFSQVTIERDIDTITAGVQTTIEVHTSLARGEPVTLEILDADGRSSGSIERPAGLDGTAVFTEVSVPEPRVVLRATARGLCGIGRAEVEVEVVATAGCAVELAPAPELNSRYAPLGVLAARDDLDPAEPGLQAVVQVATRAGWRVQIFGLGSGEQLLAALTADADGVARLPVTALEGKVGFRAVCRGAGVERASPVAAALVDTTPPGCALVAPAPGTTITAALDLNHDPADGVQLAVTARASGDGVEGEPVTLTIGQAGAAPVRVPAADTDLDGTTTASVTLAPATTPASYDFTVLLRDHAGNPCTATARYDVVL